jgi:predicted RNA-binding Zn-ribbon protein involved in translation (DUF1610 family)
MFIAYDCFMFFIKRQAMKKKDLVKYICPSCGKGMGHLVGEIQIRCDSKLISCDCGWYGLPKYAQMMGQIEEQIVDNIRLKHQLTAALDEIERLRKQVDRADFRWGVYSGDELVGIYRTAAAAEDRAFVRGDVISTIRIVREESKDKS